MCCKPPIYLGATIQCYRFYVVSFFFSRIPYSSNAPVLICTLLFGQGASCNVLFLKKGVWPFSLQTQSKTLRDNNETLVWPLVNNEKGKQRGSDSAERKMRADQRSGLWNQSLGVSLQLRVEEREEAGALLRSSVMSYFQCVLAFYSLLVRLCNCFVSVVWLAYSKQQYGVTVVLNYLSLYKPVCIVLINVFAAQLGKLRGGRDFVFSVLTVMKSLSLESSM